MFSNGTQKSCGLELELMWRGSWTNKGRKKHNQNISYKKKSMFNKRKNKVNQHRRKCNNINVTPAFKKILSEEKFLS